MGEKVTVTQLSFLILLFTFHEIFIMYRKIIITKIGLIILFLNPGLSLNLNANNLILLNNTCKKIEQNLDIGCGFKQIPKTTGHGFEPQ